MPADDHEFLSHLALILGSLTVGRTAIAGLAGGDEIDRTADALAALGAHIQRDHAGAATVDGVGIGGFGEPDRVLDLGPSTIGLSLLVGAMATQPITATVAGTATLAGLTRHLARFGAGFTGRGEGRLPLTVTGAANPLPLEIHLTAPSPEITLAVLLAALNAPGRTAVFETPATGDRALDLIRRFGATVTAAALPEGGRRIEIAGQPELSPAALDLGAA